MKKKFEATPAEALQKMNNADLLHSFEYACITVCNAHNFTKYGPSRAMNDNLEAHAREILHRMNNGRK